MTNIGTFENVDNWEVKGRGRGRRRVGWRKFQDFTLEHVEIII